MPDVIIAQKAIIQVLPNGSPVKKSEVVFRTPFGTNSDHNNRFSGRGGGGGCRVLSVPLLVHQNSDLLDIRKMTRRREKK